MIFSIDDETNEPIPISGQTFADLGLWERQDLQEWVIDEPRILDEELLVITSEYENFVDTYDRLDILALDRSGKLVIVELKRDRADDTTDLQAIKYASYCATLTAEDIQQEYHDFWGDRQDEQLSPEDVGETFIDFLADEISEEIRVTSEGWAEFELDQKPRILLAAGSFGIKITAPVMWLIEEYGMDITCIRIDVYEHQDQLLLNTQRIVPIPEAEEYMTRRRQKQEKQASASRRVYTLNFLLEEGILEEGDIVVFAENRVPAGADRTWDPDEEFWQAKVTGKTGQQNNVEWLFDNNKYSLTGLTTHLLYELVDRDRAKPLNGYKYWCHPEFEYRTLYELRTKNLAEA